MKIQEEDEKKKGDLNFKKWLLSLSSIGNLILGGLLFIMGISAMRFHLDKIFVADRGLMIIGSIIILSSIALLAILIPCLIVGGLPFAILVALAGTLSLYEIIKIVKTNYNIPLYIEIINYVILLFFILNNTSGTNIYYL